MNTFTTRQAATSDLDKLATILDQYRQFYGRTSDVSAVREFLQARFLYKESSTFVAIDGDRILGFTQLYPSFSTLSLERIFILNDLYVDENSRQRGVAKRLIAAAAEYATSLGALSLTLSTAKSNEAAQALYSATGWVRDEHYYEYSLKLVP
ncbi:MULTISPECIES: GNAT family N-acetyltransferase [unclassified Undibacterium]|uniref:GNAT family N-acetyltransferase n=1 Tax=unclassified Undibacterium TaxID=2630295 RepID=UPI002AC9DADB|nr:MULTISPECIES: GNAT family N-acetyltransferase [unclassified Undibacterium]MEB0140135.1 GNAT family N-acetyltransferase [Undibacterium sp. CCC2.1]MEB0173597.1 GNAT family N-acetyltransferase [Undibacterium sp. CCC1.1]MEB0177546.1 GNAT family N-acetyltransferase [Undibacterium sp. CCC3.4]MEB0214450.1 GNAT family N-acetyltransferase [Undibacterium sp. 5I2]WPX42847.1 GNAT family N-acetyltransferase [Undibacterium sp. CCC3.4]